MSIRAEGCNDPGAKGCGFSVIIVDGVDRSLHRRGYNLVVMNENTGKGRLMILINHSDCTNLKVVGSSPTLVLFILTIILKDIASS